MGKFKRNSALRYDVERGFPEGIKNHFIEGVFEPRRFDSQTLVEGKKGNGRTGNCIKNGAILDRKESSVVCDHIHRKSALLCIFSQERNITQGMILPSAGIPENGHL